MRYDAPNLTAEERSRAARPVLDAQPAPKTGAEIAFARAGIRPVANSAFDNARTLASVERATSNAPFYIGVRGKFAFAVLISGAWFLLTLFIALPWIAELSSRIGTALASVAVGGIATYKACDRIVDKARTIAAHQLEASEADLEFSNGSFVVPTIL